MPFSLSPEEAQVRALAVPAHAIWQNQCIISQKSLVCAFIFAFSVVSKKVEQTQRLVRLKLNT